MQSYMTISVGQGARGVFGQNIPSTLEVSESLSQLERLDDNSLLLLVVSNLSVSSQREILSQRVAVKAIVGHDSPQIGVTAEEDTKQIPNFSLVPVGAIVEGCDRGNGGDLVSVRLNADARVVADGEQVVNDFESLAAGGVVDGGDIADLGEFGGGVGLKEGEDGDDTLRRNVDCELVLPNGEPVTGGSEYIPRSTRWASGGILLDVFGKTGQQVLAVSVEGVGLFLVLVCGIDNGDVEFADGRALGVLQ